MGLITKTTAAPPTLAEQLNASSALAAAALSVFAVAANDLDEAKAQAEDVAFLAQEEIDRLVELREGAHTAADEHRVAANKVRDLVA